MYKFESDEGFRAGLSAWGYFIILFYFFAGFKAELAILLGAFGGLAVYNIAGYVQAEKIEEEPKPATATPQRSVIHRVSRNVFDRFVPRKADEPGEIPDAASRPERRSFGSRRPRRFIGRRPPRKIGK